VPADQVEMSVAIEVGGGHVGRVCRHRHADRRRQLSRSVRRRAGELPAVSGELLAFRPGNAAGQQRGDRLAQAERGGRLDPGEPAFGIVRDGSGVVPALPAPQQDGAGVDRQRIEIDVEDRRSPRAQRYARRVGRRVGQDHLGGVRLGPGAAVRPHVVARAVGVVVRPAGVSGVDAGRPRRQAQVSRGHIAVGGILRDVPRSRNAVVVVLAVPPDVVVAQRRRVRLARGGDPSQRVVGHDVVHDRWTVAAAVRDPDVVERDRVVHDDRARVDVDAVEGVVHDDIVVHERRGAVPRRDPEVVPPEPAVGDLGGGAAVAEDAGPSRHPTAGDGSGHREAEQLGAALDVVADRPHDVAVVAAAVDDRSFLSGPLDDDPGAERDLLEVLPFRDHHDVAGGGGGDRGLDRRVVAGNVQDSGVRTSDRERRDADGRRNEEGDTNSAGAPEPRTVPASRPQPGWSDIGRRKGPVEAGSGQGDRTG